MGRISTNIGLVTGFPIQETVDKLVSLQARPRANLARQTGVLQDEQVAFTSLTATLIALQSTTNRLSTATLYESRKASAIGEALTATATSQAQVGSFQFTPVQRAQAQQLQSSPLASSTAPLGVGALSLRFGGFVDTAAPLDLLNRGAGFARGKIQITDRAGKSGIVDLSYARSIDDVVQAINRHAGIDVAAETVGDRLRLVDLTGQTGANLKVQEAGGTTAASLGLVGIDVAAASADGEDILGLFDSLAVSSLRDGSGIRFNRTLADLTVTLGDGSQVTVDFKRLASSGDGPAVSATNELTIGDVLKTINDSAPGKLRASIAPDGDRILLADLSGGAGSFTVQAANGSLALQDLGLDVAASAGTLSGRRLQGGLKTSLLASLSGGRGTGTLGAINLTDRSGATALVNLAGAVTLDDVLSAINAAGIGVRASVNSARNGIQISDTSGGIGNLIATSADAAASAEKLGIAVNATVAIKNGGSLARQVVGENTLLSSLNGGAGVGLGSLRVIDATGASDTLEIDADFKSIGDVLDGINRLDLAIDARINDAGDGIAIVSTQSGDAKLQVQAAGGLAARDLHLIGVAKEVEVDGVTVQRLDGSTTARLEIGATESLTDIVRRINELSLGVTAAVLNTGSSVNPFRLAIFSQRAGAAGQLLADSSAAGFTLTETAAGQDALLLYGSPTDPNSLLVSSSSNTFRDVLPGLSLDVKQASATPVTVTVDSDSDPLIDVVETIVETYNKLHERLESLTAFDEVKNQSALLQGDGALLRVQNELSRLFTGRYAGVGAVQSLAAIGVTINQEGELAFDAGKLEARLADDPQAVRDLLSKAETGVSDKFKKALEDLAGEGNSLLVSRAAALSLKITSNNQRLEFLDVRLEAVRNRLLRQFQLSELAIARIQGNMNALASLANLAQPNASN